MSLPQRHADTTLARIVDTLRLRLDDELPLDSPMGPVGACRTFRGHEAIDKIVTVSLVAPAIGIDSHMLFAFGRGDSAVPHFTLDSVHAGGTFAFHLDLIPRVDLGSQLAYMDFVYGPLTEVHAAGRRRDGLTAAQLSPRQLALMSPWMLAHRASEAAFAELGSLVTPYLDRWFELVSGGVPAEVVRVSAAALRTRDQGNRDALFDPAVDPVWNNVERLIGADTGARIRALLREVG